MHYLAYKIGPKNCYEELALKRDDAFFYLGFSGVTTEQELRAEGPRKGDEPHPIALRILKPSADDPARALSTSFPGGTQQDRIVWMVDPNNAPRVVLITFSKSELHFWRPKADRPLEVARWNENSKLYDTALEIQRHRAKADHDRVRKSAQAAEASSDRKDAWRVKVGPPSFKFIRVDHLGSVPRTALFTAIDSLSSNQAVARFTCAALWRIGAGDARTAASAARGSDPETSEPSFAKEGGETSQGRFIRQYLDRIVEGTPHAAPTAASSAQHAVDLFNPIQLESAAFYFALDLGRDLGNDKAHHLLPDTAVGKALEAVDVRARVVADPQDIERVRDCILGRLRNACAPDKVAQETEAKLRDNALDIQCKAGSDKLATGLGHAILFKRRRSAALGAWSGPGTLVVIDNLIAQGPEAWPMLHRYIQMQVEVLTSPPKLQQSTKRP